MGEEYFCPDCDRMMPTKIRTGITPRPFKGEIFKVNITERICENGHAIHDQELDGVIFNILVSAYEKRFNLKLDDIKTIRTQYRLSDNLFAKILGIDRVSLYRYEIRKEVPGREMMALLKELEEPKGLSRRYFDTKEQYTVRERGLIEGALRRTASVDEETDFEAEYARIVGMEKALALKLEGIHLGRIKRKRRKLQLTQQELADRSAVPLETIIEMEAGTIRPNPELVEKLALALELDLFV